MQQSSMMFYHKVYMNQIHSSSLLCQLAAMWKNQVLCDAVIKTGNISTKAHRVVLVAACPMLHSMKNASTGSNLEVRLAADISQEAVNTFLQYLYEGFMMLTEANCKDVEKIARVLQVDNVLKCCSDFYKCLHAGNGYEYNFHDNLEFRHVRASDLLKVHERSKRAGEALRADSPSTKRMRSYRTSSTDQIWQTDHGASTGDPWDRVPREGLSSSRSSQPGVIDMVEDSVEIVHTEPVLDSGGKSNSQRSISLPQDRVAISVASQINPSSDVQIIDTSYNNSGQSTGAQQDSISVIGSYSSPHYQHTSSSHSAPPTSRQNRMDSNPRFQTPPTSHKSHLPSQSPPRIRQSLPSSQTKPFAAGSATQSMGAMSPSLSSPARESPVVPSPVSLWRSQSAEMINVPPDKSPSTSRTENQAVSDTDIMSEVSIIKIESPDGESLPQEDDPNLPFKPGEQSATGEDASNEGSNLSTDKNVPQWLSESMKVAHFGSTDQEVDTINTDQEMDTINMDQEVDTINTDQEVDTINTDQEVDTINMNQEVDTIKTDQEVDTMKTRIMSTELDIKRIEEKVDLILERMSSSKGAVSKHETPSDIDSISDWKDTSGLPMVPPQWQIAERTLNIFHQQSSSPGNFALKLTRHLFPELFGRDALRHNYNWYGRKDKYSLDEERRNVIEIYTKYFYPEVNSDSSWKNAVIAINEGLRRKYIPGH